MAEEGMSRPSTRGRRPRVEVVAAHLRARGHISEGSALIEYGRFRLADVIHRLRNDRRDLLPEGKEIVTIHKQDTQGNRYGEYTLVETRASATRRRLEVVRAHFDSPDHRLSERDSPGVHQSLVG